MLIHKILVPLIAILIFLGLWEALVWVVASWTSRWHEVKSVSPVVSDLPRGGAPRRRRASLCP